MTPADKAGTAPHRVELSAIVGRLPAAVVTGEGAGVSVTAVTFDHREVVPGALHCCLPGARTDGRVFAAEAHRRGAVAFLSEAPIDAALFGGGAPVVQVVVPPGRGRQAMAVAACAFEGDPAEQLTMVGVTGTNGKTTVTHLCRSVLEAAGRPTAVIGTLSGARTTPESPVLQRLLAGARDSGQVAVAMEVTSHALVQQRVGGIVYDVALFTNLTQDHLDFHQTMEAYFDAKASLFTPAHATSGIACSDDPYGWRLLAAAPIPMTAYSIDDVSGLTVGAHGSCFVLDGEKVELRLGGTFNVVNAIAAAAIARSLDVDAKTIAAGLAQAEVVPGRFEALENTLDLAVVVDYSHTPDALASALSAARQTLEASGRVIVVFGCGGDRDRAKRPVMGRVATTGADIAIVTSDNPRSEDPGAIIEEVLAGCDGPATLAVESDRRLAIAEALSLARPGDVVVIAGKGHETYQELDGQTIHFDDREVARELLSELSPESAEARS